MIVSGSDEISSDLQRSRLWRRKAPWTLSSLWWPLLCSARFTTRDVNPAKIGHQSRGDFNKWNFTYADMGPFSVNRRANNTRGCALCFRFDGLGILITLEGERHAQSV